MKALAALKKAIATYKRFIEPVDEHGEYMKGSELKAFNYLLYTDYCMELSDSTDNGGSNGGYLLRDMAMETIDKKYQPGKAYTFLGMDLLN